MRTGNNRIVLIGRSSHRATLEFLDEMRGGKAAEPTELIRSQRLIILGAERPKEGMVQKRGQAPRRNAFSPRLRAIGSEPVPVFEPYLILCSVSDDDVGCKRLSPMIV